MITIAKNVVDRGETKLTEHQFTELLMAHAKVHKTANESDAAAFSQIFSAPSEDGILLRKACAVCKNTAAPMMLVEPVQSGGNDVSAADQAQAYAKLVDLAKALRCGIVARTGQQFAAFAWRREYPPGNSRSPGSRPAEVWCE